MQLFITLKNIGIIDIPVNYNFYIQSAIFRLLAEKNADFAEHLHSVADGEKTKYKFFTFGSLIGKNHFHDKKLYFEGNIKLEIRSVSDEFIEMLADTLTSGSPFCIGKHCLTAESVEKKEYTITDSLIKIRTLSPIVSKTQTEDNKAVYYSPQDVMFIKRIRETFVNKYTVFSGKSPQSDIDILPVSAGKKIVTKYKDTWITAYHGIFELCGDAEYLQFLYDVGLGVKTSQGFGMFDVIS